MNRDLAIELKRIQVECRAELRSVMDQIVEIHSVSIRPMYYRKGGPLEYGPFPPETQACLNRLAAEVKKIVQKYEVRAGKVIAAESNWRLSMALSGEGRTK